MIPQVPCRPTPGSDRPDRRAPKYRPCGVFHGAPGRNIRLATDVEEVPAEPMAGPRAGGGGPWAAAMPQIYLASTSPRRRRLLAEAGIDAVALHPGVDDAQLHPGPVDAAWWAMALAHLKAAAARRSPEIGRHRPCEAVIVAADTVVVKDGDFIGQPRDAADAAAIIRRLQNGEHRVVTGVCLLDPATGQRELFADEAAVRVGDIGEDRIAAYVASGGWRGKAGAYNLSERLADGWPIEYDGDPTTIMGLPMSMLPRRIEWFTSACASGAGA